MQTVVIALIVICGVILAAGWIGLRVKPKPFPPYPERTPTLKTVDLPVDLPPPVARFFKTIMGDRVPVIESTVITGSAALKLFGLRFPSRFRFTHVAGQDYRHYIETTLFGFPLLKVNEYYLDGQAFLELPFGVVENEPKIDIAANLGLWAESIWLPSIFITHPHVRWEAIDDSTARLVVPFGAQEDTFTLTFDPQTGLLRTMEAKRYKEPADEAKRDWLNEPLDWQTFDGITIPSLASVTWVEEGSPWSVWRIEDVVYNVDVSEYVRAIGL